jgi:hypothetical protein
MAEEIELALSHTLQDSPQPALSSEQNKINFKTKSQKSLAWDDIVEGLLSWRIWILLAYQEIKLRYRRSVLGPFGLPSVWRSLFILWAIYIAIYFACPSIITFLIS